MNIVALDDFPDSARVWVFGSERELAGAEAGVLLDAVDGFLARWTAHGVPLRAARSWCYDRFLMVAVDIESAPPSGCSIDALVTVLRGLEDRLSVRFLGNEAVWYRDSRGSIRRATRTRFRALAVNGDVVPETVVFDNSVTVLADLRGGRWEGPARERWHAALFD
ncbi:MAG: hypothetical protein OXN18_14150 [Gemmatimonadota bacterium]|nr:hypothetical protein [Gemmatimonadota bacterium]